MQYQNHNISIGAGRNMDASWLTGRLDHIQRNTPHSHTHSHTHSQSSGMFCDTSMQDDCGMQCEDDVGMSMGMGESESEGGGMFHQDQNFNSQNFVTPVESRRREMALKRGRGDEDEYDGGSGELRDAQRLKVMNFASTGNHGRPDQGQTGFFNHFGQVQSFESHTMSMEM